MRAYNGGGRRREEISIHLGSACRHVNSARVAPEPARCRCGWSTREGSSEVAVGVGSRDASPPARDRRAASGRGTGRHPVGKCSWAGLDWRGRGPAGVGASRRVRHRCVPIEGEIRGGPGPRRPRGAVVRRHITWTAVREVASGSDEAGADGTALESSSLDLRCVRSSYRVGPSVGAHTVPARPGFFTHPSTGRRATFRTRFTAIEGGEGRSPEWAQSGSAASARPTRGGSRSAEGTNQNRSELDTCGQSHQRGLARAFGHPPRVRRSAAPGVGGRDPTGPAPGQERKVRSGVFVPHGRPLRLGTGPTRPVAASMGTTARNQRRQPGARNDPSSGKKVPGPASTPGRTSRLPVGASEWWGRRPSSPAAYTAPGPGRRLGPV